MIKKDVLVSVVIPLFYGMEYIDRLINMVKKNRDRLGEDNDIQMIFVNDSPEDSIILDEKKIRELRIVLVNNEANMGIHASRIVGLKKAIGKYILFLDQDDEIADNYIQSQLQCIGNADAVLCNGYKNDKKIYQSRELQNAAIKKKELLEKSNRIVSPGQVMIKKDKIPLYWTENLIKHNGADDAFLWMLMMCQNSSFALNYNMLFFYNDHGANTSLDIQEMRQSVNEWNQCIQLCEFVSNDDKNLLEKTLNRICIEQQRLIDGFYHAVRQIREIMQNEHYNRLAIYGWGHRGQLLYKALIGAGMQIEYIVDAKPKKNYKMRYSVILPEQVGDEKVLLIISIKSDERIEIKNSYAKMNNLRIVILEELLESIDDEIR